MKPETVQKLSEIFERGGRVAALFVGELCTLIEEHRAARVAQNDTLMPQPQTFSELDRLMTLKEAAEFLVVTERAIRQWVAEESIPYRRVGGALRFERQELLEWTAEQAHVRPEPKVEHKTKLRAAS